MGCETGRSVENRRAYAERKGHSAKADGDFRCGHEEGHDSGRQTEPSDQGSNHGLGIAAVPEP